MEDTFKNKYRIPSTRLPNWDYGSHGLYYVTICTKDRLHYFGEIKGIENETQHFASLRRTLIGEKNETQNVASLRRTLIGEVAYNNWLDIPKHFSFIELDEFVIMPNHIHGILFINKPAKVNWQTNKFGTQSQNLASVIRGYKASIKAYATINNIDFNWQPRYYDHVINSEKEYINIKEYIFNNSDQWLLNGDDQDNLYIP